MIILINNIYWSIYICDILTYCSFGFGLTMVSVKSIIYDQ